MAGNHPWRLMKSVLVRMIPGSNEKNIEAAIDFTQESGIFEIMNTGQYTTVE